MDEDHSYRRLEMTVLMTPDMTNFAGRVHGGSILKTARPGGIRLRCALLRLICGYSFG